jgi:ABC-type glycerol-3-phosphate transport system substrate-binding protein
VRKVPLIALALAAALLLAACGGGSSSSSGDSSVTTEAEKGAGGGAKTPEQVWAKEVEAVMRKFENSSARSVEAIHTSTSQYNLEPTYASYSDELTALGKQLEATKPPPSCAKVQAEMGELATKVSGIMGVLGKQSDLNPEEFSALVYQQTIKFGRVGKQLTELTIDPHC